MLRQKECYTLRSCFYVVLRISLLFQKIWYNQIWPFKHKYITLNFFPLYDLTWETT